ncbi:MAG: hypothetical protein ACXVG9_12945 [Terriglobales bacterium]
MEARVRRLEDDLSVLKNDVAVMRSNYVTKEELHKELHAMTWKIIGTFAVLCGAVFWIARNVAPPQIQSPAPVASSAAAPESASPPAPGARHAQRH